MMWPRVYMDEVKCQRLMDCLKHFRRGVPESTGEPGAPVKDEYRHGADAWGGLAVVVDRLNNDGVERPKVTLADTRPLDMGMGMALAGLTVVRKKSARVRPSMMISEKIVTGEM